MSIRLAATYAAASLFTACLLASSGARAEGNVLKECGKRYQETKAANELKGQSWQDFLKTCKASLAETPAAEAPKAEPAKEAPKAEAPKAEPPKAEAPKTETPAAKPAETKPADAKPAKKGDAKSRQKKCGEEWRAQKDELKKKDAKITWPKYLSSCVKRLKDAGE